MSIADTIRYAYTEVASNYDDPVWRHKRLVDRVVRPVHAKWHGIDGIDVMSEDWDTLVVLDGCRSDLFEAAALDDGAARSEVDTQSSVGDPAPFDTYSRVTSRGSATPEWVRRNFTERTFGDTVYVTANPYVVRHAGDSFHEIVPVWEESFDDEIGTVPPGAVADTAHETLERFPDKRLIVHFMQPHYPFIDSPELQFAGIDATQVLGERDATAATDAHDPWEALLLDRVSRDRVRSAYADNLDAVLSEAFSVARAGGRAVITSDHGNLLGERAWPIPMRLFGHPVGVRHPALVDVPWAVIEGDRRAVRDDGARVVTAADQEAVNERLRRLGYRE